MDDFASEKMMGEGNSDSRPIPASAAKAALRAASPSRPKKNFPLLTFLIGFAVLALGVFVFAGRPDIGRRFVGALDIFGISQESQMEERRVRIIMQMRLVHEKKLALIDHKVFVGATQEMVGLSLGKPLKVEHTANGQQKGEIWTYQLEGDPYSTIIEFNDGQLSRASQEPQLSSPTP